MNENKITRSRRERIAGGLFWSWNIIFLTFMALGFAPRLLPELVVAIRTGIIRWTFLLYAVLLTSIPIISVILGYTILRREPKKLFALGYVVEGPLMLMLAVRFFLIRQASSGLIFLMLVAGFGMAVFLWDILDRQIEHRRAWVVWLRLLGLTIMLLVSLYAALWVAFYALPITAEALEWFGRILSNLGGFFRNLANDLIQLFGVSILWAPFAVLGFCLLLFTATLFVLAPIAVPILAYRSWRRALTSATVQFASPAPAIFSTLVIILTLLGAVLTNRQPQIRVFELVEKPPDSVQAAARLMEQQSVIRKGLLNAYLAPFRYISALGEVGHIRSIYADSLGLSAPAAVEVERFYEVVARPLLYQPVHYTRPTATDWQRGTQALQREPVEAARLYQRIFDQTIVDGEHEAILNAVQSTWLSDQAQAGLQTLEEREVHLDRQELTVTEHGDWADIELFEVYRNTTSENQEVIYYFSLPESAVITGLWLGNTPNREERFIYHVAPRGTAQAVYRNEVRLNLDPALIEQIGPRQYRLRIFPIPPVSLTFDDRTARTQIGEAPPYYLWLTWKTLLDSQGWHLPHLTLKQNIYWDKDTVRLINGTESDKTLDDWLPKSLSPSAPVTSERHQTYFPSGYSVSATPISQVELPNLPSDLRLAIVLDRSYSMRLYSEEVNRTLNDLKNIPLENADVYLTASSYRGEEPTLIDLDQLDPHSLTFLGGQNPAELLAQFEALREGRSYDAILVITDSAGYELGNTWIDLTVPDSPVWLIHLGDEMPIGYDDKTLQALQGSGGGVTGSLDEALARIAVALDAPPDNMETTNQIWVNQDIVDGYLWETRLDRSLTNANANTEEGFAPLAARRVILAEMQRRKGDLSDLQTLDNLHSLAQGQSIVTPYSSMIVLVTPRQEELLRGLSKLDDRYQREVESLGETTPATQIPLSGVPEPEEWLLIGTSLILLAYLLHARRKEWLPVLRASWSRIR